MWARSLVLVHFHVGKSHSSGLVLSALRVRFRGMLLLSTVAHSFRVLLSKELVRSLISVLSRHTWLSCPSSYRLMDHSSILILSRSQGSLFRGKVLSIFRARFLIRIHSCQLARKIYLQFAQPAEGEEPELTILDWGNTVPRKIRPEPVAAPRNPQHNEGGLDPGFSSGSRPT